MLDWTQIELAWVSGKHCVFRAVESDDEVIRTDVAFLGGPTKTQGTTRLVYRLSLEHSSKNPHPSSPSARGPGSAGGDLDGLVLQRD